MNRVDLRRQREAGSLSMHPKGLRKELENGDSKAYQQPGWISVRLGINSKKRGNRLLGEREYSLR